ncbi:MAG: hypothetical protein L6R37_002783 [Teloschistes peruensis]|nr:MAG: hypothetical protein L6R37_002783 [Teloschistes peruensis]
MSSRALRKLQREQEKQKQLQQIHEASDDEASEHEHPQKQKALNTFDILNQSADSDEKTDDEQQDTESANAHHTTEDGVSEDLYHDPGPDSSKAKAKQKKKRKSSKKSKNTAQSGVEPTSIERPDGLDEIDLALKSLSTHPSNPPLGRKELEPREDDFELYRLLAVESRNLNAANEMKRLFGNVVLERENDEPGHARRRGRIQQLDLGGALAGRNSPVSRGQGLAGLALRRNVFIAGKEEWPKATSGGLGMELVEKFDDETIEYRFVHNTAYQNVQRQFDTCVESLDPQRLIQLLQFNRRSSLCAENADILTQGTAYHISTLLQVSEIAKQQSDHSVSGDLLERALFSFGRSVHSSFITALSEGKARFDFRRPENREFWLAVWRYIANLGQRGTWRTSYEWAKLLLALDPEGDPYCVHLNLDHLALRGGQAEHFISLCDNKSLNQWMGGSNLSISKALAESKLKDPHKARLLLRSAIIEYPYIFSRLFQELSLDHVPKSIWGQKPRTAREKFSSEVYVHNAKDLWNTPEAISLLVEVAESTKREGVVPLSNNDITLDEARHILLSGIPALIDLLPRSYTTMPSTSSDPLPPLDNLPSYASSSGFEETEIEENSYGQALAQAANPGETGGGRLGNDEAQELQGLQRFFSRLPPWFRINPAPDAGDEIDRAATETGVPEEVIEERSSRLVQLLQRVLGSASGDGSSQGHSEQDSEMLQQMLVGPPQAGRRGADDGEFDDLPEMESAAADVRTPEPSLADQVPSSSEEQPYDDEKNQRWLAGQGIVCLRAFTAEHGADENAWGVHTSQGQALVAEYARRVQQLRQQRTRDFIINYPLQQGTNTAVRDLVRRQVERTQ